MEKWELEPAAFSARLLPSSPAGGAGCQCSLWHRALVLCFKRQGGVTGHLGASVG